MSPCDHYHRMPDDVALMKDLGLQTYRFSTSWSRVRADGGPVNPAGLDFYSRLVDELLEAGIEPWLTLYHWDLPQALEERGGWANRDTAFLFRDYALSRHGRSATGSTCGRPSTSRLLVIPQLHGRRARSRTAATADGLAAVHHLMLGHGLAVEALRSRRARFGFGFRFGFGTARTRHHPQPHGRDARRPRSPGRCRRGPPHRRAVQPGVPRPDLPGAYPADLIADLDAAGLGSTLESVVHDGDLATISAPIDTLGVNHYHGEQRVSDSAGGRPAAALKRDITADLVAVPRRRRSTSHAPAGAAADRDGLGGAARGTHRAAAPRARRVHDAPGVKLYVTENGAAYDDVVEADDGAVQTSSATSSSSITSTRSATIDDGVHVHGYFVWSLLDNFEWAWGYEKRFGIVHVDYETQVRTAKDSGQTPTRGSSPRRMTRSQRRRSWGASSRRACRRLTGGAR